ncbi:MAG: hypothetical protein NVS3B20_18360 [Polyangiales bacterium]
MPSLPSITIPPPRLDSLPSHEPHIEVVEVIEIPHASVGGRSDADADAIEPADISLRGKRRAAHGWQFLATVGALALAALLIRERAQVARFLVFMHLRTERPPVDDIALTAPAEDSAPCPNEMALVARDDVRVCVDRWEASLVEIVAGNEVPFSPYLSVQDHTVMAVSRPNVVPQAYISRDEAEQACAFANKRLCESNEWRAACEGPSRTTYPYGDTVDETACNTHGKSPLGELFGNYGDSIWDSRLMNDPSLNALEGTVARTGAFARCTNGFGVFDMVGNGHEWCAAKTPELMGVFRGGYYLDTIENGPGCRYATTAHQSSYHDYSTGFRCCKDPDDN